MTLSRDRLWLAGVTWLGTALRFHGLFANRFHADEALFATWARLIAVWRDPLLLTQAVDKPPLLFYLQALFFPLFGPVEWAARMPNLVASILLIPATGVLARRLYGDRVAALVAASVVAVAPLAVQFSATAFSDPLLTFWLVGAMLAAVRSVTPGRFYPAAAGVCFGLALATKYQALLFLPIILGIAWLTAWRRSDWLRALAGFGVVLAMLLAWQAARSSTTPVIALQWANIGGLRPAWSWELLPRLGRQASLWRISLSWPLAIAGAALFSSAGVLAVKRRVRLLPMDALTALFVAGYLLLHWLWAVPVWDRYLLPLLPLVAVLLGRAFALVMMWRPEITLRKEQPAFLMFALIILAALVPGLAARTGSYPIGGRPDADGGAALVAALLADAPYGTVLYDHWYSWHWRYQLFDRRVYISWFPHVDALLEDLAVFGSGDTPRFIALPVSSVGLPVVRQLYDAGYRLEMVVPSEGEMALFRIEHRVRYTP